MSSPDALRQLQEDFRREYSSDVRLANQSVIKGSGSPGALGDSLFNQGVRYGSVLQDVEPALPFFLGSRLAFELALTRPAKQRESTVYDVLYKRFAHNFGYFASSELVSRNELPADTTRFRVALSALQMAFTSRVLNDAKRDPASFRTTDFAAYLITFLALNAVARCWGFSVDPVVGEQIALLPIPSSFECLRQPLAALAQNAGDAEALANYRSAFRASIHPGAYKLGLIGGIRFTEAYIWSLAKESGRMTSALADLLVV